MHIILFKCSQQTKWKGNQRCFELETSFESVWFVHLVLQLRKQGQKGEWLPYVLQSLHQL